MARGRWHSMARGRWRSMARGRLCIKVRTLINYRPISFLCCFLHGTALWPHRGGSQHREPQKSFFNIFEKVIWSRNKVFFLRISIIFCMRETVIISNGSRILPCLLGPKNDLKTTIYFFTIFENYFLFFLRAFGDIVTWCHRGAIALQNQRLPTAATCLPV